MMFSQRTAQHILQKVSSPPVASFSTLSSLKDRGLLQVRKCSHLYTHTVCLCGRRRETLKGTPREKDITRHQRGEEWRCYIARKKEKYTPGDDTNSFGPPWREIEKESGPDIIASMRLYSSSSCSTRNSGERDNACLYSNYTPCCINFNLFLFLFSYNIYEKYMRNNRRIGESIICGRSACARNIFQKRENIPRQTEFHIPSNERAEESHTHSISIFI